MWEVSLEWHSFCGGADPCFLITGTDAWLRSFTHDLIKETLALLFMIQINKKSNYTKYTRFFRASSSSCDPMSSTNKQILQNYRSENNWNTPKFNGAKSISISVTFGLCIPLWVNKWQMLIFLLSVCLCVSVLYPYLYHFAVLLILWETWFEIVYLHLY